MKKIAQKIGPHTVHLHTWLSNKHKTVILVHGLGVSTEYYMKLAARLSRYYDVYSIDLPGYGSAPTPPQPLTVEQLSAVLIQCLRKNSLTKNIVVGQSMGCQIVAQAARNAPELFTAAVLISPTVNDRERTRFLQSVRLVQDTFLEPIAVNRIVFSNYLRMGIIRYLKTAKYMVKDHIEKVLPDVLVPVLIVRGAKDPIVPERWVDRLRVVTPTARLTTIPDGPHLVHYTHPEQITDAIREFIHEAHS